MLIKRLHLKKLLSFNDSSVELGRLNVLIGSNAVGKSNLIEVVGLLHSLPTSISTAILRGGGIRQWLWLGDREPSPASVDCELTLTGGSQVGPLLYQLQFSEDSTGFLILREQLSSARHSTTNGAPPPYIERSRTQAEVHVEGPTSPPRSMSEHRQRKAQQRERPNPQSFSIPSVESVLALVKNPLDPTPITEVGNHFAQIRIFREFRTGPGSPARVGVSTNIQKDVLMDGGDNLAIVLNELNFLGVHDRIRDYLRRFCERFEDVKLSVGEGLVKAYLREAGLVEMLSAIRMSDGTLKFLALLAALFHPKPPPLMCIEEPEIGLHPDALQLVAEALVEASQSVQLIVTTHSEALVDALSDRPESVLVCERDFDNGTQFKRLSKENLKGWLERYTLGQLWRKGEIGGGRW